MSDAAAKTPANPALPLFFERPEAMNPARHGTLGLVQRTDFECARHATAIPVVHSEMPMAMRSYPIVFVGPNKAPVIVTALKADQNLFVGAEGSWAEPHYVPAYVRRYPFVLADDPGQPGKLTLCVDRASSRVVERVTAAASGTRIATFFDGDQPSEATRQALAFCEQFQRDFLATRAMVEKVDQHGLFAVRQGKVTLEGGEVFNLTDFQVIDEAAFNKLSDDAFLDLRRSGALGLVYCHLASVNSWPSLMHQAKLRKAN